MSSINLFPLPAQCPSNGDERIPPAEMAAIMFDIKQAANASLVFSPTSVLRTQSNGQLSDRSVSRQTNRSNSSGRTRQFFTYRQGSNMNSNRGLKDLCRESSAS